MYCVRCTGRLVHTYIFSNQWWMAGAGHLASLRGTGVGHYETAAPRSLQRQSCQPKVGLPTTHQRKPITILSENPCTHKYPAAADTRTREHTHATRTLRNRETMNTHTHTHTHTVDRWVKILLVIGFERLRRETLFRASLFPFFSLFFFVDREFLPISIEKSFLGDVESTKSATFETVCSVVLLEM